MSEKNGDSFFKNKGFTLIEFLIYSVIVAFMTGTLILAGVNIMQGRSKVEAIEEVNHNGRMITEVVTHYIRQAENINYPSEGIAADYLSLEMPIAEESPIRFYVEDSVLLFERGSAEASPLTSERVRVSSIQFTNTSYPESAKTVKMVATIEYNNLSGKSEYDFAKNFYVTENIKELAGIEEETTSTTYVLTLEESPSAGGTAVDNTNNSPYEAGEVIDINASVEDGYIFSHWSDSAGGTFGNSSVADTNYIMPAEDATVTANFDSF